MVAAAALAAAAATPLPLQQRHIPHQHPGQNQTTNSNSSSAAPSQPRTPETVADSTFRKGEKIEKDTNHSPGHPKNVTSPKPEVKTLNNAEVVKTSDSAETIILNQPPSLEKPTSPKPQEDPQKLKVESEVKPEDHDPQPLVPQKRKRDQTETTTTNPDGSTTKTKTVKIASPSKKAKRDHSGSTNPSSSRPSSPSSGVDSSSQQPPLLPSYGVDPDAGVIGCICGYDHDDGFTIQCDRCFRWQHAVCMNIKDIDDVPDNYLCYLCDPESKIDASKAQKVQEERLQPKRRKSSNSNVTTSGNGNSTGNDESSTNNSNNKGNNGHSHSKSGTPSGGSGSGSGKSKRKKNDDSNNSDDGLERYQTLYFSIDRLEFKTSSVKSLVDKLPKLIKQRSEVLKFTNESEMKAQFVNPKTHLVVKSAPENPKAKFTGISKLGLFAGKSMKNGQLIDEMVGELDLKQDYIEEPCNQYWLLGCCKPKVFFHPHLPIVIDERGLGNLTRFVRKSCQPNCEIKTVILTNTNVNNKKGSNSSVAKPEVRFVLHALHDIKQDQELTLPWEWDVSHPIRELVATSTHTSHNKSSGPSFEDLSHDHKQSLINSIHFILQLCDCACPNNCGDACLINKVKKITSYLSRKIYF
ncbi:unnamed protein product [Ambrosiozyma monospora]|uniref:Unnamed protein product n=1 Tax=Ambrosiozyma monospora TaxID=43982 RepID=A0ACB5T306_AMBMO|nr:unnamed protein product [Ambrosiozyma monospora]